MSNPTQRQLAEKYYVSQYVISKMMQGGIDIYSEDAVESHIMGQRSRPKSWINGCPWKIKEAQVIVDNISDEELDLMERVKGATSYDVARTLKTQIDAIYKLRQIEIQNREFIHIDEVKEDQTRIGSAMQAAHNKCQADLPAMLEGLSVVEMEKKISEYMRKLDMQLSDSQDELYKQEAKQWV